MEQKLVLDEWLHTSRYIYNKTLECINKKECSINFFKLRDKLVTNSTRKTDTNYERIGIELKKLDTLKNKYKLENADMNTIKGIQNQYDTLKKEQNALPRTTNSSIKQWELETPKDVRASAVKQVVTAFKSNFTKLAKGQIDYFHIKYQKKTNKKQSLNLEKEWISLQDGVIRIYPKSIKQGLKIGTYNKKLNLTIEHGCTIVYEDGKYYLNVTINPKVETKQIKIEKLNYCGVDPGVRDFMTTFGNNGCKEYKQNFKEILKKLNSKIDSLKRKRCRPRKEKDMKKRGGYRRNHFRKIENRKSNLMKEFHYTVINEILKENDVVFYGDIKSHDIVKGGRNRKLNRDFNDLKFYQFKQRLQQKAILSNKVVICVNEAYTTQTCSSCGVLNKPHLSKIYKCSNCKLVAGRDINAAKCILLKGIILSSEKK